LTIQKGAQQLIVSSGMSMRTLETHRLMHSARTRINSTVPDVEETIGSLFERIVGGNVVSPLNDP
jgi:hypothetical protein